MFNQLGDLLKQQSKRWAVKYDARSGAWHILDLWHESLASLTPESEVPIDSPALRVLSGDAFNALVEEANRLGVLARFVGPTAARTKSGVEEPVKGESKEFYRFKVRMEALGIVRQIVALDTSSSLVE